MSDVEKQNERERLLLRQLDGMDNTAWAAFIRYMAPTLAAENNKLLLEIVIWRGVRHADKVNDRSPSVEQTGEAIALMCGVAGLKLVPQETK